MKRPPCLWVFVRLCETKIGAKSKIVLHGYRQLYSLHENRDIYSVIVKYVKTRFDTSNYELDRPLPKTKNKKVIGLAKNELRGKAMTQLKMYSYLKDDRNFPGLSG